MERKRGTTTGDVAAVATLAALILLALLSRYPARNFRLPMGPDSPVYMWWANLAQLDGLSVANWRPGTPALSLMLGEGLGLSQLEVAAGLGSVFAATIALASYAAVRAHTSRWPALLAGALAGAYATHLAGGYFGNIIIAAMLMTVVALLGSHGSRHTTVAAVALLAAGGLAHPMFLVMSLVILAAALPFIAREERGGIIATGLGAGAVTGLGLLAMLAGPRPLKVDTSADDFMRRAGMSEELVSEFRSRLSHHVARYLPWLMLPLAWLGRRGTRGTTRALLEAWAWLCLIGVVASFAIGAIPGVRMIAFAFPLPVLAALGVAWTRDKVPSRVAGTALAVALVAAMLAGAGLTWARERPYADPLTVDQVQRTGEMIRQEPANTPLVFVVDEPRADLAGYRTTNWGNILRAYLPPDRIADVHLYYGTAENLLAGQSTPSDDPTQEALSHLYLEDLQRAEQANFKVFRLSSMTSAAGEPVDGVTDVVSKDPPGGSEMSPSLPEPGSILLKGWLMFVAITAIGAGWARTVTRRPDTAFALAPAFGAAALILTGVALDRLGLRLDGPLVPISGLVVGLGGYLAAWLAESEVESSSLADQPA